MSGPPPAPKASEVPTQVFEQFLVDLSAAGIPDEVVTRLRKTLLEEQAFTDTALKLALFGEELAS